jgi:cytochrome d ubiquinol oxidase subunit II
VAAIVAGWALAQSPEILPGLTVRQAAAPHDTQVTVLVAIVAGAAILAPSLVTLFRLTLGRFASGESAEDPPPHPRPDAATPRWPARLVRIAGALLIAGFGFTNVADAEWAHVVGALCLIGFVVVGFRVALPLGPGDVEGA